MSLRVSVVLRLTWKVLLTSVSTFRCTRGRTVLQWGAFDQVGPKGRDLWRGEQVVDLHIMYPSPLHLTSQTLRCSFRLRYVVARARAVYHGGLTQFQTRVCIDNFLCDNAISVAQLPFLDSSTNSFSKVLFGDAFETCRLWSYLGPDVRAGWYRFTGTGRCVRITLWGSIGEKFLAVYLGDSCDALVCVTEQVRGNGILELRTDLGVDYWIHAGGTAVGSYTLGILVSCSVRVCDPRVH